MKNFHNIIEQVRLSDKEFEIIDYSLLEDIGVIEDLVISINLNYLIFKITIR